MEQFFKDQLDQRMANGRPPMQISLYYEWCAAFCLLAPKPCGWDSPEGSSQAPPPAALRLPATMLQCAVPDLLQATTPDPPCVSPPHLPCRLAEKDPIDPACDNAGCERAPNANARALSKFLDYALKKPEVRFVRYSDLIRWMQVRWGWGGGSAGSQVGVCGVDCPEGDARGGRSGTCAAHGWGRACAMHKGAASRRQAAAAHPGWLLVSHMGGRGCSQLCCCLLGPQPPSQRPV